MAPATAVQAAGHGRAVEFEHQRGFQTLVQVGQFGLGRSVVAYVLLGQGVIDARRQRGAQARVTAQSTIGLGQRPGAGEQALETIRVPARPPIAAQDLAGDPAPGHAGQLAGLVQQRFGPRRLGLGRGPLEQLCDDFLQTVQPARLALLEHIGANLDQVADDRLGPIGKGRLRGAREGRAARQDSAQQHHSGGQAGRRQVTTVCGLGFHRRAPVRRGADR